MADIINSCEGCQAQGLFDLPVPPAPFDPSSLASASPVLSVVERDSFVLCDPTSGARVVVVTTYDVSTGIPTSVGYNLNGTPYAGPLTALIACGTNEESDAVQMCDGGNTPFIRWVIKKNGAPTGAFFDTHLNGATYVPAGIVTIGACPVASVQNKIYSEELAIGSTRTVAQIVAATLANSILSITLVQVSGNGSYSGDAGGTVNLMPGMSQSWSVGDGVESLAASALSFNSGTGTQHLTAIYR